MISMQRYSGEHLGTAPHIVVLGSCKVGNFVVSTPVLQGLKHRFQDAIIGFIGSDVTADFEESYSLIDWRVSWDDSSFEAGLKLQQLIFEKIRSYGDVQLALNLDGFNFVTCSLVPWLRPRYVAGGSLTENLRRSLPWGSLPQQRFLDDPDWSTKEFVERYKGIFSSNYIAELFCQLAFVADQVDSSQIQLPTEEVLFQVPDVLIHCTTARSAKVWPFEFWRIVIDYLNAQSFSVGLVGSAPSAQRESYNSGSGEDWLLEITDLIDLRGQTSLIQLAGACKRAKAVISVDAGPLHIAGATGVPTLAVVGNDVEEIGASPLSLWLPRCQSVQRTVALFTCSVCAENRFRNDDCLVEGHPCMASVAPQQVIDWLNGVLAVTSGR